MKDQRSGVIKFTDLTGVASTPPAHVLISTLAPGEKRDFSHLPDYIGREDPNCWPGWKGAIHDTCICPARASKYSFRSIKRTIQSE